MIKCQACGTGNQDNSQYCDECGSRLESNQRKSTRLVETPKFQKLISESQIFQSSNITAVGVPPVAENLQKKGVSLEKDGNSNKKAVHAKLVIERGKSAGTEFLLTADESYMGRWDADNGVFPDVDLDKHDSDAKVSRRHARVIYANGKYFIEDLGSTNGTFVNRGRRLIPGIVQPLNTGDEIIIGKTFLRFYIVD
jgi:FHA domain